MIIHKLLSSNIPNADDISWGSTEEQDLQHSEKIVPEVLKEKKTSRQRVKHREIQNIQELRTGLEGM